MAPQVMTTRSSATVRTSRTDRVKSAVVIGASTGIGLALSERLARAGYQVVGFARREAGFAHEHYRHVIADVTSPSFRALLAGEIVGAPAVCVYAAGIGHEIDLAAMTNEVATFATNLLGFVMAAEVLLPRMIAAKRGHLVGLSSQADRLIDAHAPSYAASKAGMSAYLEGLALAARPHGVAVTNVRFGFVDTAMAKSEVKPFLISAERAAQVIEKCLVTRPMRRTYPLRMAALLWLVRWWPRLRIWGS